MIEEAHRRIEKIRQAVAENDYEYAHCEEDDLYMWALSEIGWRTADKDIRDLIDIVLGHGIAFDHWYA